MKNRLFYSPTVTPPKRIGFALAVDVQNISNPKSTKEQNILC